MAVTALMLLVACGAAWGASNEAVSRNSGGAEPPRQGRLVEADAEVRQATALDPIPAAALRSLACLGVWRDPRFASSI
jgi:Flp pilus assembly protein TadD